MTSYQVCVDSNIVLKLAIDEQDSDQARALWEQWAQQGTEIVAPPLLWYEVISVLRHQVHVSRFTVGEGREALDSIFVLSISSVMPAGFHQMAWELATQFGLPTGYDAHYLAVAHSLACEFWTADKRLYNAVKEQLPWVRSLQEAKI